MRMNKLNNISLLFELIIIFIGSIFSMTSEAHLKIFSLSLIILMIYNLLLIIINFKKSNKRIIGIDKLLMFYCLFLILSCIFAYNFKVSIFGTYGRYEGFISLIFYISIMLLSSFIEKKSVFQYEIIVFGLFNFIVCVLQISNFVIPLIGNSLDQTSGLCAHSNFMGTLFVLSIGLSLGNMIKEESLIKRLIFLILSVFFSLGIFMTQAMSAIVTLIILLLIIFIYGIISRKKLLTFICILLIVITNVVFINSRVTSEYEDLFTNYNDATTLNNSNNEYTALSGRLYIWKEIIKRVPDNLLLGIGIDNLFFLDNGKPIYNKIHRKSYDKAHNEYLQILITEGIFAFIIYLIIVIKISFKNLIDDNMTLFLPIIGYLIQAFFNISIIYIAPFFWVLLGMSLVRPKKRDEDKDLKLNVLLSVMNLKKKDLAKMNIKSKCIVVNQSKERIDSFDNFKIINSSEIGLSKSRNKALLESTEEISLLCDDDVTYVDDLESIIIDEYNKHKDADIIIFNIDSPFRGNKKVKKFKKVRFFNLLRYESSRISFRTPSIINNNIKFNEEFGSNSKYNFGEDTLFIVNAYKKNLNIYVSPINIGKVEHKKSQWFKGYNEEYFYNQGVIFSEISKNYSYILSLQHLIRHKEILKDISFKDAYKIMCKGINDYNNI